MVHFATLELMFMYPDNFVVVGDNKEQLSNSTLIYGFCLPVYKLHKKIIHNFCLLVNIDTLLYTIMNTQLCLMKQTLTQRYQPNLLYISVKLNLIQILVKSQ